MLRSSLLRRTQIEAKCYGLKISSRRYNDAAPVFGSPLDGSKGVLTRPPTITRPKSSKPAVRRRHENWDQKTDRKLKNDQSVVRRIQGVGGVPHPYSSKVPVTEQYANWQVSVIRRVQASTGDHARAVKAIKKPAVHPAVRIFQSPGTYKRPSLLASLDQPDPVLPVSIHRPSGGLIVDGKYFQPALLRDACTCSQCVDPSSTQKNFQTTDIPSSITIKSLETLRNGEMRLKWNDDVPGFGEDHITVFAESALHYYGNDSVIRDRTRVSDTAVLWDTAKMKKQLEFVDFEDYMNSDKSLWRALWLLLTQGLMIVRNVPGSEKSVEDIALRIGNIRDSLYGRTWDVKSVPDAKNVAYTAKHLGLHMDLLYMADPPGFQFLHCLKSTAEGGASLFADAFNAAKKLHEGQQAFLAHAPVAYQYKNAGEHYYHTHPVIELERKESRGRTAEPAKIRYMNYSPPFQANYLLPHTKGSTGANGFLNALRAFAKQTEKEENLLEYRLQEGECVIFNNRRILHGRKQFDALGGERWLKGTYVDADVVHSRYRVLERSYHPEKNTLNDSNAKHVFEDGTAGDQDPEERELAAAVAQS